MFLQKHNHGKELRYEGLPNEKIYRKLFGPSSVTGHMAYGSGSVVPPRSQGVVIKELIAPLYKDLSIRDEEEDILVIASPAISTAGGHLVNQRSRSIEKRRGKKKAVYKSNVVMQMWYKAYEESKQVGSVSIATSSDFLETCQDILEAMELPTSTYSATLQLFIKEPPYQKVFVQMKAEHRLAFLEHILGSTPYYPQPPPPSDF